MKLFTILFSVLFLTCTGSIQAQFSKGTRMVGATIGSAFFNSGKSEYSVASSTPGYTSNTNAIGINLSPSFGWFLNSSTVVGGRLLFGYDYDKIIDDQNNITFRKNEDKQFSVSLGAFARKYFGTDGFIPFAQLNIDAGTGNTKKEGFYYASNYKETYSGKSSGDFVADAGLSLGLTKMLNKNVGLDIFAGYLYSYEKTKMKTTTSKDIDYNGTIDEEGISNLTTKSTTHGVHIGIGLQVFLGK